jgi:hypothetical protein
MNCSTDERLFTRKYTFSFHKKDCLDVLYAHLQQRAFDTPALGAGYKPFLPVFPKGLVG